MTITNLPITGPHTQTFTVSTLDDVVVETGGQPVIIDKLYGPAIVCRVKLELDLKAGHWVVFREVDPTPEGVDQWPLLCFRLR
jgi:hypothetical protein